MGIVVIFDIQDYLVAENLPEWPKKVEGVDFLDKVFI